jgi:hypothetical protein
MADEERQHAERLLYEYRRRLRYREHQKARLGDTADPFIDADIAELRQNIAMLEPVVEPAPADEVVQVVRRHFADDYLFLYRQLVKFGERLTRVESTVGDVQQESAAWRKTHAHAHQANEGRAIWGRRRNLVLLLAVIVIVIAILSLLLR